ncbi:MAG TPA: hypothetical protein VGN60_02800 [Devosia sp.]|jgi:hypothetical protein|nr:hypothetical protein [Devosia sp.]
MSLFVSFPYEDRIELLTDAASYLPTGLLMMTHSKVRTSKTVPMAVTGRGHSVEIDSMINACLSYAEDAGSFGQAMIAIEREFDEWRAASEYTGNAFQLYIAGHIEGHGLAQYQICSIPDYPLKGMEPMRVNTLYGVIYAGPDTDAERIADILSEDRLRAGAREFGPDLCQYLRGLKDHSPQDPLKRKMHGIGGHIDLTTITATGATTERLLTWPDRPFMMIDPDLQPDVHIHPPALERRATAPIPTFEPELEAA